jgi:hypothetical protein
MTAASGDREVEEVGRGHERPGHRGDAADVEPGPHVAAVDEVDAVDRARRHQVAGPAGGELLGRLEQEAHLAAGQAVGGLREQAGRAEEHRGVRVVPARMHHARALRREVEAARLLDRQRVDVRAQRDDRAGAAGP